MIQKKVVFCSLGQYGPFFIISILSISFNSLQEASKILGTVFAY